MEQPLVTCITPTANREKYLPLAINYFLLQDYPNKEMVILDDGERSCANLIPDDPRIHYFYFNEPIGTIGEKRNKACELANGEIIAHFDDDDYYAFDWLSRQVEAQLQSGADITGMNSVDFYSPIDNMRYRYINDDLEKPWICGATMAFSKSFWKEHPFGNVQVGEDYDFIWQAGVKLFAFDYPLGFVALLHAHNTSLKPIENPKRKKSAVGWDNSKYTSGEQKENNDPLINVFCNPENDSANLYS